MKESPYTSRRSPILNYDKGYLGYLSSGPNSAGVWELGSGEKFQLRCVLAPFKVVLRNSGIWAGGFCIRGKGLHIYIYTHTCIYKSS